MRTHERFRFFGTGSEFFGIWIVNGILTFITLGLYFPWATVKVRKYLYSNTELQGTRFAFHGTGKEVFKGFVIFMLGALGFGITVGLCLTSKQPVLMFFGFLIYLAAILGLPGYLLHGALGYRASRSSFRAIRFSYIGDRSEIVMQYIKGVFLSAVTFGIYLPWFEASMYRYILGHLRYGTAEFEYHGKGNELFWIYLKFFILTPLTLGLWVIQFTKEILDYTATNVTLTQDGETLRFSTTYSFGTLFGVSFTNFLLVVFTLGLGTPWAIMRSTNYLLSNLTIEGDLDLASVGQTDRQEGDAIGEAAIDGLDIGFGF